MLPKPAKDLGDILFSRSADDLLVTLAHVGLEAAQIPFDLGVRGQRAELPLEHLPHGDEHWEVGLSNLRFAKPSFAKG